MTACLLGKRLNPDANDLAVIKLTDWVVFYHPTPVKSGRYRTMQLGRYALAGRISAQLDDQAPLRLSQLNS